LRLTILIWAAALSLCVCQGSQERKPSAAELKGVPLNGIELQAALAEENQDLRCSVGEQVCRQWKSFILPNMFYFKVSRSQRRFFEGSSPEQLVLVPKGASWPRKFAGGNEEVFAGARYISDPSVFYASPK